MLPQSKTLNTIILDAAAQGKFLTHTLFSIKNDSDLNDSNNFEKKPYSIRLATQDDISSLMTIEHECWSEALQVSESNIVDRIQTYPEGQCVIVDNNQLVGVIYSIRIVNKKVIYGHHVQNIINCHDSKGPIIVLVSINVLPEFRKKGMGDRLLDFMLSYSRLKNGVKQIVAVSRCQQYLLQKNIPLLDYIHQTDDHQLSVDPILRFHQLHGATITRLIPGYRPDDHENNGCGVLIEYAMTDHNKPFNHQTSVANHCQLIEDTTATLKECICHVMKNKHLVLSPDTPFHELGMESLEITELCNLLNQTFDLQLTVDVFFDHFTMTRVSDALKKAIQIQHSETITNKAGNANMNMNQSKTVHSTLVHQTTDTDIAIIGMACKFPGAPTITKYWDMLKNGVDAVTSIPDNRMDKFWINDMDFPQWGGFLDDVDCFDAKFFNISPHEAKQMDPQQRMLLEVTWEAIENSGLNATILKGSKTGVFAGIFTDDYKHLQDITLPSPDIYFVTGTSFSTLAGRLSYFYDFQGPSVALDTACSSSLTAVHLACQSLKNHDCNMALACGINLILSPKLTMVFQKAGMLSEDGRCKTFDEKANGYVRSEGCGVIVLKPLNQAIADHNNILAVISGSAVNHDGASNGLTAPNALSQENLIKNALADARIEPTDISYVEAHGTGTILGDPIEIKAIKNVYGKGRSNQSPLIIGSVKTNIGHCEAAAGMAGLIKTVLSLQHAWIPAHLHYQTLNHHISLNAIPAVIPIKGMAWSGEQKRMAGVSSFGFSGTNAHVILSEYSEYYKAGVLNMDIVILLSAKTKPQLTMQAKQLMDYLLSIQQNNLKIPLSAIAYTLQTGRVPMSERLAIQVTSIDELIGKLDQFCHDHTEIDQCYYGYVNSLHEKKGLSQKILHEKSMNQLAQLWVSGANIDWNLLYQHTQKPCPVMLPTYPFDKKRYWIFSDKQKTLNPLASQIEQTDSHNGIQYYAEAWKPLGISPLTSISNPSVLIFSTNDSVINNFQDQSWENVIAVYPGDTFVRPFPHCFQIRPQSYEDYDQLFSSLDHVPSIIIHLWSQESFMPTDQWIETHLTLSLYSLFYIIKAMSRHKPKDYFQILYGYRLDTEHPNPVYESIRSFACAVREENANLAFKTIGLDDFSTIFSVIENEIHAMDYVDIQYIHKQRQVRYLHEIACPTPSSRQSIKKNGVYLITGGAGKIGLIMAKYLANQETVKLILCGRRSELDNKQIQTIKHIENSGSEVKYFQMDISRQKNVISLIKKISGTYGTLDGIIHCSGVIQHAYLTKKDQNDIATVLMSKVFGTIYLDEATKNISLDFFVLFSSVSSIMANMGLSDYAYANCFLDNFTRRRQQLTVAKKRFGKTISINWPMWSDGGMHHSGNSLEVQEFLKNTTGMVEINTHHAIDILNRMLSASLNQLIVIPGNFQKIKSSVEKICQDRQKQLCGRTDHLNRSDILIKINSVLALMISKILEFDSSDIDINEDFKIFGFDSISFTLLANAINEYYQIDITPARFFGVQTIVELSATLLEEYPNVFIPLYSSKTNTPQPPQYKNQSKEHLQDHTPITHQKNSDTMTPIAIIGMSGMFPQSEDIQALWQHLVSGHDLISEIPPERWQAYDHSVKDIKWGGFIPDVDKFDAHFFAISPKEAELMDPQQRLCLQTVWKTIEDAGYKASDLSGSQTGIFIGMQGVDYAEVLKDTSMDIDALMSVGTAQSIIANRISYLLNLHGPSESIDTACSSSLVAIHRAILAIRHDHCQMAIAGGINLLLSSRLTTALSQTGVLSKDGRCKTFDKDANGYVRSEGVGAVLLKPLDKAEADHDHIYAVIKGSAENHGGRVSSLTAPNPKAQADLIVSAHKEANVDPTTVTYIEAHGTGTSLGDPVEIDALKKAFEKLYDRYGLPKPKKPHCGVGSVKTTIGHSETAAGVAGVIKVIMSMKYQTIPGNIHFKEMNPYIELKDSPFYIVDQQQEWKTLLDENNRPVPRRAGVSSFGFGGSNAHVILEEYIDDHQLLENTVPQIIILSAKNKDRLIDYAKILLDYCNQNKESIPLINMAYTLQAGRETMDERLAMVVSNMEELIEKLSQFTKKSNDQPGIYTGNQIQQTDKKDVLIGGEAGKLFIQNIYQTKDLNRIAHLWTLGFKIDWNLLYDSPPRRISLLPTYPFEKDCYWISSTAIPKQTPAHHALHPMLHMNTSTINVQQFRTHLTGHMFFLMDHVILGKKTLPGVVSLEIARAASEISCEQSIHQLSDITWLRPIQVANDPIDISIQLYPDENNISFEIRYNHSKESCVQGIIHTEQTISLPEETLNISEIKQRCYQTISGKNCYTQFHETGFQYGPTFQTIHELYIGEKEVLAHLTLPKALQADFEAYMLHPSLMDGALQTVSGFSDIFDPQLTYVPFSIGNMFLYNKLKQSCYAYTKYSKQNNTFDILITDSSGQICVQLNGYSLRPLPKEETSKILYFQNIWKKTDIQQTGAQFNGTFWIFDHEYPRIQDWPGAQIIRVWQGDTFIQSSKNEYYINPYHPDDYQQLIKSAKLPECIIYVWTQEQFQANDQAIHHALIHSVYSLFYLCQALLKNKLSRPICIIHASFFQHPVFNSISAFAKTIHQENPLIFCKTVILDKKANISQCLTSESLSRDAFEIRYFQKKREIRMLQEIKLIENHSISKPFKKNGVYVITGGIGGIGLIITAYLARQYHAKIALCGRKNSPGPKQIAKWNDFKQQGSETRYYQADLSEKEDVFSFIQQVKKEFGPINGVFHCAGIIMDSFVIRKKFDDIMPVLSPKIFGSLYLDQALEKEALDFFILFSSTSAVIGNSGQCDYAFANCFMDHFASLRNGLVADKKRFGKTISINWPLWKNGGMTVSLDIQSEMKHMGILPLSDSAAIDCLITAINANKTQIIPFEGYTHKIFSAVQKLNHPQNFINLPDDLNDYSNKNSLLDRPTQDLLKKILSDETNWSPSKIDINAPLEKYGIDSIMVVKLTNRLEKIFGPLSKTLFFEYQKISELKDYFIANYSKVLQQMFQQADISKKIESSKVIEQRKSKNRSRFSSKQPKQSLSNKNYQDIAIIGLSGRYPMADDLSSFWNILRSGTNCITEIPINRFDISKHYDPDRTKKGNIYAKWGGLINDADKFDALFFNISPREAEIIDPQERLVLETVWHTLENAGYSKQSLSNRKIGVYIGVMYGEYQFLGVESTMAGDVLATSSSYASIANRISYYFNLQGPSMAIDTMCSSSLTAIHLACESLKNGEIEMGIAGGVNLSLHLNKYVTLSQGQFLSSDGLCRSFGENGDGYVPGEGVGAVLLKPLNQAIADRDIIYAVIKGSSINHGGKTNGYSVPNPNAQANLISETLKKSDVHPGTINYLEAHGTGTSLGDPIEITGLSKAYQKYTQDKQYCAIGSVKSNIGHLESAAGIAAVTKVILQMQHKQLVPSLHSDKLNFNINFADSPFYVQQDLQEWKPMVLQENGKEITYPLRAGVSSFGAGGANAHVILEAYETENYSIAQQAIEHEQVLIVLSAKNKQRLNAYSLLLANFCEDHHDTLSLTDIAYTLQTGREAMDERLAMVVSSIDNLHEQLRHYHKNALDVDFVYTGNVQNKQSTSELIIDEDDGRQFVQSLIQKQKLSKIGSLWVSGLDIDWRLLYTKPYPKRISLPGYPFEKKRHWVSIDNDQPKQQVTYDS
ncbi:MAG: SDR family NAD(P)-dependent oxidoreductase, partial [Candidatus Magnetomorum sp.]|nr:SDR family NAD(P)-dependent oxidoreductase [Candidatus Magnetomorum sp.]